MAEKLPVIIDIRGDNTVVNALRRLLPSLQKRDVATGVFSLKSGGFSCWRTFGGTTLTSRDWVATSGASTRVVID